ncbi:zinc finger BED domain-containing protein 5-like [Macrobrachium rosenbergii]|uniref:zinc finger BED domain-containing protein 5-like n=1 Tax=Macrobrachium rosenbergii TaxID=79674 RepID=UPI0034D68AAF
MRDVLNVAIKVVNFIKAGALNSRLFTLLCKDMESEHEALLFHTNVQSLSKGNMLGQLYELCEEVAIFPDLQHKTDLHDKFMSEGFPLSLAYLVDMFEALNAVSLKLQGKTSSTSCTTISFERSSPNSNLWKSRVQNGNTACFSNLVSALSNKHLEPEFKKRIITHLTDLKAEFIRYFPDIDEKHETWKFTGNPFHCDVADISEEVQEEFLELEFNSTAEEDFKELILRRSGSSIFCLPSDLTSGSSILTMFDPRIFMKRRFPYSSLSKLAEER